MEMKYFIQRILLFLLPLALIFVASECLLRQIPNIYSSKYENFVKSKHQIKTLVLGNSHTLYGINPHYLSMPSYNIANVGQSLLIDLKLLEKEINTMNNLETLIIPISYYSLWQSNDRGEMKWRKYCYLRYYHLTLPVSYNVINKYSLTILFGIKSSIATIENYLLSPEKINLCDNYGWRNNHVIGNPKNFIDSGKSTAFRHESNDIMSYNKNIEYLNQICLLAQAHHKKLIFVFLPTRQEYRINLNQQKVGANKKVIQELQNKYPNVRYLDYENSNLFNEYDFFDVDHLSSVGAIKFTRLLDGALLTGH